MRNAIICGSALVCALMMAAPAGATQYFFDDFNDGDMSSDWTDLTTPQVVRPFNHVPFGHYGYATRGEEVDASNYYSRARKDLDDTNLSDTVYISFQVMHAGGWKGGGGTGYKRTRIWWVNDVGEGFGLEIPLTKTDGTGQMGIKWTYDFGETQTGGSSFEANFLWAGMGDFSEHLVEVVYDRVNATMDLNWDGSLVGSFALDLLYNSWWKDFTKVVLNPVNTFGSQWETPEYISMDEVWIGSEPNPNVEPQLVGGDTDGNLKVDIVDLTALAANWSTISAGAKDWTQADFNYDWMVDIVDLTALAANWTFGPGDAPPAPVPEPTTMALFALTGLALLRKKR